MASTERIVHVVWKDEGDFGFVTTYTAEQAAAASDVDLMFGMNGTQAAPMAWSEVERFAADHGAELVVS